MRIFKVMVLALACLAIVFSVAPLLADNQSSVPLPETEGSWTVTCTYDGNEKLISKSCTSGGTASCNCA